MLNTRFNLWVNQFWYAETFLWLRYLLWPAALLFQVISQLRRAWWAWRRKPAAVPIIVVGNLTVGGVGKTPLVIALAHYLTKQGLQVGIVSRGYGARISSFPHCVREQDEAWQVGDEPKLMALKTQCPVVIAPKRLQAVNYLLRHHQSQVIISDDGLQHYAMPRAIEIVVIDGLRGIGSGWCLPAGPLRESIRRLHEADFIVVNGQQSVHTQALNLANSDQMVLQPDLPRSFTGETVTWQDVGMPCSAVAGIGNPQRFFTLLTQLGVTFQAHQYADHHVFLPQELASLQKPVIMTEKDAVKCRAFATEGMYYLPVEAKLSDEFWKKIWVHIQDLI